MQTLDPFLRIVEFFDKDETAGSFLREDGDGGFAGAIHRMAREIDALRAGGEPVAKLLVYRSASCNGRKVGTVKGFDALVASLDVGEHPLYLHPAPSDTARELSEARTELDERVLGWAVAAYNTDAFSSDKDHTAHIVRSYLSTLPVPAPSDLERQLAEARAEIARLEDENYNLRHEPWPRWADEIRKCLEGYGVDPGDEWDLPQQFEEWLAGAVEGETSRADKAEAERDALAADKEGLMAAAQFLVDRLDAFDLTDDADEMCKEFIGHIEPAHERLRAALSGTSAQCDTQRLITGRATPLVQESQHIGTSDPAEAMREALEEAAKHARCAFDDRPRRSSFDWNDGFDDGTKAAAAAIRAMLSSRPKGGA